MVKDADAPVYSLLNKNRLEALTDGIFAFALTLLVLNIEVPSELPVPLPDQPVQALLLHLTPDFIQYFTAFLVLASFWFSHHLFFNKIRYVDRTMTWLSIFGLLFVALIPFSTELSDTYTDFPLAALIFELNVLVIGILFIWEWKYASHRDRLLEADFSDVEKKRTENRLAVLPVVALIGVLLAVIGFTRSTMVFFFLPLIYLSLSWIKD